MNLKKKFIVPILSAAILSIAITIGIQLIKSRQLLTAGIQERTTSQIATIASNIDGWLDNRQNDVKTFSGLTVFVEFAEDMNDSTQLQSVNEELRHISNNFTVYQSINIIDSNGDVVASSVEGKSKLDRLARGEPVYNLSERSYFQQSMNGENAISEMLVSKVTDVLVFCISSPIVVNNEIVGVLYAVVDHEMFEEHFVTSVKVGETGYAYLLDAEGTVIGHPNSDYVMELNISGFDFGQTILKEKNGTSIYTWNGVKKLVAFKSINHTGWIIAEGLDFKEVFYPVGIIQNIGIISLLFSSLILAFIIIKQVDKTLMGIQVITDASGHLSRGDLSYDLSYESDDEIGVMANEFRKMSSSLQAKTTLAQTIASGDLTCEVPISSDQDTLGFALKQMVESTIGMLNNIQSVAGNVNRGSSHVSDLSQELSDNSVSSAAAIEEISRSMKVISDQAGNNAKTSGDVSTHMSETKQVVEVGKSEMLELEGAMEKISSSSSAIGTIIKVIDDIAFQTNLLALNAAVEAARAGVHGKGFAVVADEVRNLAGRSAKAAQESTALIEDAKQNVTEGDRITNSTAQVFSNILLSVEEVSVLIDQIHDSSSEQSSGVNQIVSGVSQIEGVIHQNTASSEETASASQELSSQSKQLNELVSRFKIPNGGEQTSQDGTDRLAIE